MPHLSQSEPPLERVSTTRPPPETPGHTQASSFTVVGQPVNEHGPDEANTEFTEMVETYRQHAQVDQVTGPIGPLYYAKIQIAGVPTDRLVDTGSSVTILSLNQFKKLENKQGSHHVS